MLLWYTVSISEYEYTCQHTIALDLICCENGGRGKIMIMLFLQLSLTIIGISQRDVRISQREVRISYL